MLKENINTASDIRLKQPGGPRYQNKVEQQQRSLSRLMRVCVCVSPQGLTAYHDLALDKCYIIELNTTLVMPPRSLWELLVNVKVRPAPAPGEREGRGGEGGGERERAKGRMREGEGEGSGGGRREGESQG